MSLLHLLELFLKKALCICLFHLISDKVLLNTIELTVNPLNHLDAFIVESFLKTDDQIGIPVCQLHCQLTRNNLTMDVILLLAEHLLKCAINSIDCLDELFGVGLKHALISVQGWGKLIRPLVQHLTNASIQLFKLFCTRLHNFS